MGADAAHVYGGIIGVITAICEDLKMPYSGIPVKTIKKLATGHGNASKAEMVIASMQKWCPPYTFLDDEADALWCAEALRSRVDF